jgi:hypothetical protein
VFVYEVAFHPRAQEAPIFIVALFAKNSHTQAEQTRPRKVIERHAADQHLHGLAAGVVLAELDLLFSADEARRAVDQIDDHRADAN